jgi:hypothetical protein
MAPYLSEHHPSQYSALIVHSQQFRGSPGVLPGLEQV